ncbi:uncharacterized protein C3orf67 homolog isoform X2 [Cyprinodon tularosa]|uniref:uncharacterized protein C3orf67 homolog isoform X2 n=1 Tax=Cyprinodon tularosa TaxID=77115 RepID=UPI0018E21BBE|nr:uncharacterized protein C3orf67 homolog isoform X2 [Cyprinodon tularosa]
MFKGNYQGGAVFDLFSGQGNDPVAKWKLCGGPSAIHKEYNKEVKGFVYCLKGSSHTVKMQMPENAKMSLGLIQPFLVLQVNVPERCDFSIELVITDLEHLKRRIYFSTVHKEISATLLHAKIPFTELKRNTWSTVCIDLVSIAGELFKGFLTLDGITLFATCKVRRIFTMKTDPKVMSDAFLSGACLMEMIPRSFCYPSDVNQITNVLNYENLQRAEKGCDPLTSASVPDQSPTATSSSYRRTKPQGVLPTASGSHSASPSAGRTSSTNLDRMERSGSSSCRLNQKKTTETQKIKMRGEDFSHGHQSNGIAEGASCKLQPRPPKQRLFGKQGSKKLRVLTARRETVPSSVVQSCSPAKVTKEAASTPEVSQLRSGLSPDPEVWNCWESNEGSEPQLTLQGEVFTFSSLPHSPRRGQNQGDQEKMELGDSQVQRTGGGRQHATLEDDFIGSESDEDTSHIMFHHQQTSMPYPATSRSADRSQQVLTMNPSESLHTNQVSQNQGVTNTCIESPCNRRAEPASMVPKRCLSPNRRRHKSEKSDEGFGEDISISLCRRLLHEVHFSNSKQPKEEDGEIQRTVESSNYISQLHGSMRMYEDDEEELRMLASLKRQEEEDECRVPALRASQIHQCDVSISLSNDDPSTWTHIQQRVDGRAQPSYYASQPAEKVRQHREQFGKSTQRGE